MISENLARELWNEPAAALGKRMREGGGWREIVGVAQDVRDNGVDATAPTIVYWPLLRLSTTAVDPPAFAVRSVTVAIRSPLAGSAQISLSPVVSEKVCWYLYEVGMPATTAAASAKRVGPSPSRARPFAMRVACATFSPAPLAAVPTRASAES